MIWFSIGWWKFLLSGVKVYNSDTGLWFFQHIWCRANGHPSGVVWYNPSGLEPDMRCRNCYDDLG